MQLLAHHAGGICLQSLLPEAEFLGGRAAPIVSCCGDSRQVRPGDLFVAMVGKESDGHEHVLEAVQRGATAVLSERLLPVQVPNCIVEDSRQAYGRICHALAGDPSDQLRVVGVTGSYGKTITSLLLTSMLEAAGRMLAS